MNNGMAQPTTDIPRITLTEKDGYTSVEVVTADGKVTFTDVPSGNHPVEDQARVVAAVLGMLGVAGADTMVTARYKKPVPTSF